MGDGTELVSTILARRIEGYPFEETKLPMEGYVEAKKTAKNYKLGKHYIDL